MERQLYTSAYLSPIGPLLLGADADGLVFCCFGKSSKHRRQKAGSGRIKVIPVNNETLVPDKIKKTLHSAEGKLDLYFQGRLHSFSGLKYSPGGTSFQKRIWRGIAKVPYGRTIAYGELARRVGKPRAYRAAASACRANPLGIFVPCHRITSATGLGGYNGGIAKKKFLLRLESAAVPA